MNITKTCLVVILSSIYSLSALGQHNPAAHTHGQGHMTLVFESGQLIVELKTPALNMLGFEHQPTSEKQWKVLDVLKKRLQEPNPILELKPSCQLKSKEIDVPYSGEQAKTARSPHNEHAEHHADEDHKGHQHAEHADIIARYEWRCKTSEMPKINVGYFAEYPGFETLRVEWVVNGKQGVNLLNSRNSTLDIRQ